MQKTGEDYVREDRVLRLLHTCSHLLYHRGGNRGQARILLLLRKYGECTQRELLDYAGIRSASLSELISRMEATGILSRDKCEEDRRNMRIALTEEGQRMAERQEQEEMAERQWLLTPLEATEQEQLSSLLQKLCDHWITGIRPEDIDHITNDDRSSLR